VVHDLQQLNDDSQRRSQPDILVLWFMHERILFLSATNDHRGRLLDQLGNICLKRWKASQMIDHLKLAVYAYKDTVRDNPGSATYLEDLGIALFHRFEQLGDVNDINRAVSVQEDAVCRTPDGHPDKACRLNNLGVFLRVRFERLGDLRDLNESISTTKNSLHLSPDEHPDKPARLNNLGNSLLARFERLGDLSDLNESISMKEDALCLTPDGHPDKPGRLNNLGNSLLARFERLGDLSDLNESISKREDALRLTPDGDPDKPGRLDNLGVSLLARFKRLGDLSDLNESISKQEDAVCLTPDELPAKYITLNNLGNSLLMRFERLGDLGDLNESISKMEDAACLTLDGHPAKPAVLSNLGNSLQARFKRLGDLGDLNECISKFKHAVCLTPNGHPDRPVRLNNYGNALFYLFERFENPDDLQDMILQFRAAACSATGATHVRSHAALMWTLGAQMIQHPSLVEASKVALDLLPELAWLGLSINDRHYQIRKAGLVVREAAAAAVSSSQPGKAVEWLEQGRSIIWGQLLHLRNPVDALKAKFPELATEFIRLSIQLESATTRGNDDQFQSLRSIAQEAHENAHKRDLLLKTIQELEGFQRFLFPKTLSELSTAAQKGPVVLLNVNLISCDALALLPRLTEEVIHVPLPEFTPDHVNNLTNSLAQLIPFVGRGDIDRLHGQREGGSAGLEEDLAHILSELWLRLVKPVLAALSITVSLSVKFVASTFQPVP
jgi:tetratricopeptide (TPR) repeat protein